MDSNSGWRTGYEAFLRYLVPVLLACSLSVALGFQVRWLQHRHGRAAFTAMEGGLEEWKQAPRPWRPRILSALAASTVVSHDLEDGELDVAVYRNVVQLWGTLWFLAISLLWILALRERSIFFLLGTYAATSYGYMPGIDWRIFPWDLPALFFATLFTLAIVKGRFAWLFLIPLAVGFKETALVFAPAFLLMEGASRRKRLTLAGATMLAGALVKVGIGHVTDLDLFVTMSSAGGRRVIDNLASIGRFEAQNPFLLNAGLLASFLLLPVRRKEMRVLKVVGLLFVAGTLYWGNAWEVRIWFEAIPLCLCGLALHFLPDLLRERLPEPDSVPS